MAYEINYKDSVVKELRKLETIISARIIKKIRETLSSDPYKGIPLRGKLYGLYRIRIGNYRVAYIIYGKSVLIICISPRKNAYR